MAESLLTALISGLCVTLSRAWLSAGSFVKGCSCRLCPNGNDTPLHDVVSAQTPACEAADSPGPGEAQP
jgi:hypothetical protein